LPAISVVDSSFGDVGVASAKSLPRELECSNCGDRRNVDVEQAQPITSTRAFRARRYDTKVSENLGSSRSTRTTASLSMRVMTHSVMAVTVARRSSWPVRHPSPKKGFGGRNRTKEAVHNPVPPFGHASHEQQEFPKHSKAYRIYSPPESITNLFAVYVQNICSKPRP
jgi:hypothetical protein